MSKKFRVCFEVEYTDEMVEAFAKESGKEATDENMCTYLESDKAREEIEIGLFDGELEVTNLTVTPA